MTLTLHIQIATTAHDIPNKSLLRRWVKAALREKKPIAALTIRLVDEAESASLNEQFRHKSGPTNVLSFPFESVGTLAANYLGDIVLCVPLVAKEAAAEQRTYEAHFAHLVVHGTLHLLGYDHVKEEQAVAMESQEKKILLSLGYSDPYEAEAYV